MFKIFNSMLIAFSTGLIVIMTMTACDLGVESGVTSDERHRQRVDKLKERYDDVVGTYLGEAKFTANNNDLTQNIMITIQSRSIKDGNYSDGSVKLRPVLKGSFQLEDVVLETDYQSFDGALKGNHISLSYTPTKGDSGASVWMEIDYQFDNGNSELNGVILRDSAPIGSFTAHYFGPVEQEEIDEDDDRRRRLMKMYAPMVGTYKNADGPSIRGKRISFAPNVKGRCNKSPRTKKCGYEFEVRVIAERKIKVSEGGTIDTIAFKANFVFHEKEFVTRFLVGDLKYDPFTREVIFIGRMGFGEDARIMAAGGYFEDDRLVFDRISDFKNRPWITFTGQKQ